jgi:galactosylceramidase
LGDSVVKNLAIILSCICTMVHSAEVTDLKCEGKVNPTGITAAKPTFAWTFVPDEKKPAQGGYRVCMASSEEKLKYPDLWDTGPTSSPDTSVTYRGEPLRSGQRVYWQVLSWSTKRGLTKSKPSWFEMGEIANPEIPFQPNVFTRVQDSVTLRLSGKDSGRTFEGIGAVSAGASTDLLYDYEEPVRGQILDLLFKPKFGAGFQHLKVEMGGGENSTCGSEPSHAITKKEIINPVSRGYEFWFMKEARNRNSEVILEYLPWSFPGWLKPNIFTQDAADYFVAFLDVAKRDWDLDIDWVAAAENENGTDRDWLVNHMRPALDAKGYSEVKIQGPDDNSGDWQIFDDLENDSDYQNVIKAVGYHYVTGREFTEALVDGRGRPTTAKAKASGVPLWASEDWSWTGKEWGGAGALTLARMYNKFYIRDQITKTLIWAPIGSITPRVTWDKAGAMKANRPWSGFYEVWPCIWATAHTTQFAEPDRWEYIDGGCGLFDASTYKGSCVTLKEKNGSNWSMIVCTEKAESLNVSIEGGLSTGMVHVWKSDQHDQFVQQESIKPTHGTFSIKLDAKCIYSLTTTTGQQKGQYEIPSDKPFPFPYKEDYEGRDIGDLPKYHSDQKGSFEIAENPVGGQCLKQICPQEGYEWMRIYRRSQIKPNTLVGDAQWSDYTCRADVFIEGGHVDFGGRVQNGFLKGNRLLLTKEGNWTLVYDTKTVAKGSLENFDATHWHELKLSFKGSSIEAFIDGKSVAKVQDKPRRGYVSFASSYDQNLFDNLSVMP